MVSVVSSSSILVSVLPPIVCSEYYTSRYKSATTLVKDLEQVRDMESNYLSKLIDDPPQNQAGFQRLIKTTQTVLEKIVALDASVLAALPSALRKTVLFLFF